MFNFHGYIKKFQFNSYALGITYIINKSVLFPL